MDSDSDGRASELFDYFKVQPTAVTSIHGPVSKSAALILGCFALRR